MSRNSGVASHINLVERKTNVVSEFTFWPLGTVMSFSGEQSDNRLTPIHQRSQYPFDYAGSVDLDLSLNPVASAYPLDFRAAAEVKSTPMKAEDTSVTRPSDEELREIINKAIRVSGEKDSWIWSGNPKTMRKLVDRKWHKNKNPLT